MNILPLPAFTDNYIWLIEENGKATVVDPGDAEVVNNCLKEKNLALKNDGSQVPLGPSETLTPVTVQ